MAAGIAAGRMPAPQRLRLVSLGLTIRMTVAMTLMPDASYTGVMRRLAGHLADVPFDRAWHVPTSGVAAEWRGKVPPAVMQELFWLAAGPLAGGDGDDGVDDDDGPVLVLAGMPVCGIDGMLVALADTPHNRAMFGCTGTRNQKGPGSAPFPQLLAVVITARAGRAKLGAITGAARAGERTLLARLIRRRPDLFAGRVFVFDRNFPGHKIITAIVDAGGHVVARVKSNLALPVTPGGCLPDGSRLSCLNAPSGRKADALPVRVAEHNVVLPCGDGQEVSETCTLISTLLDHQTVTAEQLRGAYQSRWPASETTFGEDKTTIAGAGDRTSGPVLRSGSPRLVIQEFWAWTGPRQRRRVAGNTNRGRASAAAARSQRPGHHRRGVVHHCQAQRGPLDDPVQGHRGHVPGRPRRPGRGHQPRHAAHADQHRPAAPFPAGTESPARLPACRGHQENRHRHPRSDPVPVPLALAATC